MDVRKVAQSLHPLERRVLPELELVQDVDGLAQKTGLKNLEVVHALQWLEGKKAIELQQVPKEVVCLDKNGELYRVQGLPERMFLLAIKDKDWVLSKLQQRVALASDEINVCLGLLRSQGAIMLTKDKELKVKITELGKKMLQSEFAQERFLKKSFPLEKKELQKDELEVLEQLKKRKQIVQIEVQTVKSAKLTELGRKLIALGVRDENLIESVTPQMLATGDWKNKTFRRYDVQAKVPQVSLGKKQPYQAFLDQVRRRFVALGFQEMTGPIVESDFWDMDALYMPQFHSARDIHDVYYVKEPKYGRLDEALVKKVALTHESGGSSGSKGWNYEFDVQKTHRLLLRSQGTAASARMLASKDLNIPGKYFGISRVFRYDIIDATHLPDFNQVEGIVLEENLTFRHLIGLLKTFAKEFAGAEDIRLAPAYFPFTEPSVELHAKHPQLGWIELGGAGIFRPEVVTPLLGRQVNVCAWGLGIDRLAMFKLGFKDIRSLFSHDINFLRKTPVV